VDRQEIQRQIGSAESKPWDLFGRYFTDNAPTSCEKCEKNAQNMQKKSAKMQKVQNVNVMQKWNQNSHRIALHYCNKKFHIFSHRI
jgi:hypothetical protein